MSGVTGRFVFVCGALLLSASGLFADGEYQRTKNGKTIVWNDDPKAGHAATWFGDRDREGYATRMGTLTWYGANGAVYARYFGNMVRGKFDGVVNVHSQGKTEHAIFADGQRTTAWATGPAASRRVTHPPAGPPLKPAAAAEAPAKGSAAVRGAENVQGAMKREGARHGESVPATAGRTGSGEQYGEANAQRPNRSTPLRSAHGRLFNSDSLPEHAAQGSIEDAPANERSGQRVPPAKPAVTPETASAAPSPTAQPEAPAEGPPVVQTESAPATASSSSGKQSAIPSPESFPAQAAQPRPGETPSVVIQPSNESVSPPPTRKQSEAGVDDSLQSIVSPPPSLPTIPETAGSSGTGPRLTKEQVIRIANAAARAHGYNRADYYTTEPQYNAAYKVWSVSYEQSAAAEMEEAGQHFTVIVDDKTKGTLFELSR